MELLSDRVLLVTNPAARRAAALLPVVRQAFLDGGVQCDIAPTERPGHAAELATERSSGYRSVFVLGGDGTVMEVLGALAHSGVPVGILPGGTGNLVARSLGVPLDVRRAVGLLLRGGARKMDLGITGQGRRFAFSVGAGVDARMIAETGPGSKRAFGTAAYAFTAIRCALLPLSFTVRAEVDGELVEREAAAIMIANSGGVLNDLVTLGPGIRSDDGLLDLCVFSPKGGVQSAELGWRLLTRRFDAHPAMLYRPGREFRIECDPPQIYQADGELLGTSPFEARVEAGAATVICPNP